MQNITPISKEELYNQCLDYCLPVSRTDSVETLKNFLIAAYDEVKIYGDPTCENSPDNFHLDEEPIYIGKKQINFGYLLSRIFSLF